MLANEIPWLRGMHGTSLGPHPSQERSSDTVRASMSRNLFSRVASRCNRQLYGFTDLFIFHFGFTNATMQEFPRHIVCSSPLLLPMYSLILACRKRFSFLRRVFTCVGVYVIVCGKVFPPSHVGNLRPKEASRPTLT